MRIVGVKQSVAVYTLNIIISVEYSCSDNHHDSRIKNGRKRDYDNTAYELLDITHEWN